MNNKVKRKNIIFSTFLVLLVSIITLTVVYAALSTTLNITGSTDIVAATWDVHFENAKFVTSLSSGINTNAKVSPLNNTKQQELIKIADSDGGHKVCDSGTDCIGTTSGTTTSFTTAPLSQPGDFKAISFDIVNAGSIDAKLNSIILSGISAEQDVYLNYYVKYSDGTIINEGDILTADSTKTLVLVIEFDKSVTESQLPSTQQNLNLSFSMNYVQNN